MSACMGDALDRRDTERMGGMNSPALINRAGLCYNIHIFGNMTGEEIK